MVCLVALAAGHKLLKTLRDEVFAPSLGVPAGESKAVEKAASIAKKTAEIAVGAALTATTAGLAGIPMAAGFLRGAGSGGGMGAALQALVPRSGGGTKAQRADAAAAARRSNEDAILTGSQAIYDTPEAKEARARAAENTQKVSTGMEELTERLHDAEQALAAFNGTGMGSDRLRYEHLRREGMDQLAAQEQVRIEKDAREEQKAALKAAVDDARAQVEAAKSKPADKVPVEQDATVQRYRSMIIDAINREATGGSDGSVANRIAQQEGVSEQMRRALRSVEEAERQRAKLIYRGMKGK